MALDSAWVYVLGGLSAVAAIGLATWQIVNHLQHYTSPVFQRYIVRIIFMVPVYAICSFLALVMPHNSVYFETVRVIYEAFVIYTFLSLCLGYVGGPGEVEVKMNGAVLQPSCWHCTCCLPAQLVDGLFVRRCKQGALQFVLLMPILGVLSVILYATHNYTPGYWGPSSGYLYITIVYNITYSVALFALFMFYVGAHDLLAPFNPMMKFILVKAVVFFTFWQGILIAILVGTGAISNADDGLNLQNLLICLEMLPAAIAMFYAFPYTEYKEGAPGSGSGAVGSAIHAISIHDVASDTVHQFAPTYRDYVLYSDSKDGEDGDKDTPPAKPRTFRAKTFVPVGQNKANEKPNADLLSNMEMGNAANWANGSSSHAEAEDSAPIPPTMSDSPGLPVTPADAPPRYGPSNGTTKKSDHPDLTFVNDESLTKNEPASTAASTQQPPARAESNLPAWADVDL